MAAGSDCRRGFRGIRDGLRAPVVAFVVCCAVLHSGPVLAAAPAFVCIVRVSDIEGFEPGTLDAAVRLESRKSGVAISVAEVADVGACPSAAGDADVRVVMGGDVSVAVRAADGTTTVLDLAGVPPGQRAGELARCLVDRVTGTRALRSTPLFEREVEPPGRPPDSEGAAGASRPVGGYVYAAGRYGHETGFGLDAGAIEAGGGVTLMNERLAVGIRAGCQPWRKVAGVTGARSWEVLTVPILAEARLGWRLGPVWLRPGIAAGIEVRRHAVTLPTHLRERALTSVAPVLDGEIECMVRAGPWLRVAVAGTASFHLVANGWNRSGDEVYRVPRVTIGAVVRLGVAIPGAGGG